MNLDLSELCLNMKVQSTSVVLATSTHKLLSVVVDEELLQLQAPVVAALEDAVLLHRLAHVAPPRVQVPRAVGRARAHQDVQAVHTETPKAVRTQTHTVRFTWSYEIYYFK